MFAKVVYIHDVTWDFFLETMIRMIRLFSVQLVTRTSGAPRSVDSLKL